MDRKVSKVSSGLFDKFKREFMRLYGQFEPAFEAELSIFKVNPFDDQCNRFSVEFNFKTKESKLGPEDASKEEPQKYSKKDFSKGKKIIFVMCLILALNSIEPVL